MPLNGFNGNISFTFQAIQKRLAHPMNLCYEVFCKFLSYLREKTVFLKRVCKIVRSKKY